MFIDESHVTIPQVRGMSGGDTARKKNLIDYGFRLPSAYDNRPLKFDEFLRKKGQTIYVSATPGPFEKERAEQTVEQIIRPTGLLDPEVEVRPVGGQIDELLAKSVAVRKRRARARYYADEKNGRGFERISAEQRRPVQVYALRYRDHRPHRTAARPARG